MHLHYDSLKEIEACTTTKKAYMFVPYIRGLVIAQGYAPLEVGTV